MKNEKGRKRERERKKEVKKGHTQSYLSEIIFAETCFLLVVFGYFSDFKIDILGESCLLFFYSCIY